LDRAARALAVRFGAVDGRAYVRAADMIQRTIRDGRG
jgi:hypothetical protein